MLIVLIQSSLQICVINILYNMQYIFIFIFLMVENFSLILNCRHIQCCLTLTPVYKYVILRLYSKTEQCYDKPMHLGSKWYGARQQQRTMHSCHSQWPHWMRSRGPACREVEILSSTLIRFQTIF